jgi:hypothetical protein
MQNYHLVHDGDKWKLVKPHAQRPSDSYEGDSKVDAVRDAAKYVQDHGGGSVKIHFKDKPGIQEERTYPRSADPGRSPG